MMGVADRRTVADLDHGFQPLQYHVTLAPNADATAVADRLRAATDEAPDYSGPSG